MKERRALKITSLQEEGKSLKHYCEDGITIRGEIETKKKEG